MSIPTLIFYLPCLLIWVLIAIYVERKLAAFIQNRLGPMEVGYKGMLQTTADLLKLLGKEIIIPTAAHTTLFTIAPLWIVTVVLVSFCFLPVNPNWPGAPTSTGLLWILALLSLKPIGILVAGWASNNKFSQLGAMRAAVQFFAYEIPLGISILCVVLVYPSFNLTHLIAQQGLASYAPINMDISNGYFLGFKGIAVHQIGGICSWHIWQLPCLTGAYILFFIASLCMSNRIPFDLAESETELVGGYHTEYSGLYFGWLMVAEYALLLMVALLGVMLFLGGWNSPLPNIGPFKGASYTNGFPGTWSGMLWSFFWLFSKTILVIGVQMWIKWTLPRFRPDQLLRFCWLYVMPISLFLLLTTIWWITIIL